MRSEALLFSNQQGVSSQIIVCMFLYIAGITIALGVSPNSCGIKASDDI